MGFAADLASRTPSLVLNAMAPLKKKTHIRNGDGWRAPTPSLWNPEESDLRGRRQFGNIERATSRQRAPKRAYGRRVARRATI